MLRSWLRSSNVASIVLRFGTSSYGHKGSLTTSTFFFFLFLLLGHFCEYLAIELPWTLLIFFFSFSLFALIAFPHIPISGVLDKCVSDRSLSFPLAPMWHWHSQNNYQPKKKKKKRPKKRAHTLHNMALGRFFFSENGSLYTFILQRSKRDFWMDVDR